MNICVRCGNEWKSRIKGRPKNCPCCKSPLWDKPKASAKKASQGIVKEKSFEELVPHAEIGNSVTEISGEPGFWNLTIKDVPDELMKSLRALASGQELGKYCLGLLVEHGKVGRARPARRKATAPDKIVSEVEAEDMVPKPKPIEAATQIVPEIAELRKAGMIKAASALPEKAKRKRCFYCDVPVVPWGSEQVHCNKCGRNFPAEF